MKTSDQNYWLQASPGGPVAWYRADAVTLQDGVMTLFRGAVPVCSVPLDEVAIAGAVFDEPQSARVGGSAVAGVLRLSIHRGEVVLSRAVGVDLARRPLTVTLEMEHGSYYPAGGPGAVARAAAILLALALVACADGGHGGRGTGEDSGLFAVWVVFMLLMIGGAMLMDEASARRAEAANHERWREAGRGSHDNNP